MSEIPVSRHYSCCVPLAVAYSGSDRGANLQIWDTGSIFEFSTDCFSGMGIDKPDVVCAFSRC
jgi:hypothetical protein